MLRRRHTAGAGNRSRQPLQVFVHGLRLGAAGLGVREQRNAMCSGDFNRTGKSAKHRLHDMRLALDYAEAITVHARLASGWARQMRIFILEDLGEREAATVLLGGLLDSGEVTEPKEIHFLTESLEKLRAAGKSSAPSENRHPR